jgi:ubiquinone/menaquinone biosynthesis C-methylase UbiE
MKKTLAHQVCYNLAKAFLVPPLNRFGFRGPTITRYDSTQLYDQDRISTTNEYLSLFSPFVTFKEKIVLDLGCGRGYLLDSFLAFEPFTAIGVDTSAEALRIGRERYGDRIQFIQGTPTTIPVPSASVDIVYTIDTVEHLSRPREIFLEIARILKPGGVALVHFGPFRNPYGSHMEDIIPFPWPHILFSMTTLREVAARLYDSPDFSVACYSMDERTRQKKPNPYLDDAVWDTFLNHISIRKFNHICDEMPLRKVHQERIGFGGKTFKISRLVRNLAKVPLLDDFFCSALYTVLQKPDVAPAIEHRRTQVPAA